MTKINPHRGTTKTLREGIRQMMSNKTPRTSHHRNRWRLKTTPWNRWASGKGEELKWTTWWTKKNRKRRIPFGWIKGKTFLGIWKIRRRMRTISRVVKGEMSLIAISDRLSRNITTRRRRSWMNLRWIRKRPGRGKNSRNSCVKSVRQPILIKRPHWKHRAQ